MSKKSKRRKEKEMQAAAAAEQAKARAIERERDMFMRQKLGVSLAEAKKHDNANQTITMALYNHFDAEDKNQTAQFEFLGLTAQAVSDLEDYVTQTAMPLDSFRAKVSDKINGDFLIHWRTFKNGVTDLGIPKHVFNDYNNIGKKLSHIEDTHFDTPIAIVWVRSIGGKRYFRGAAIVLRDDTGKYSAAPFVLGNDGVKYADEFRRWFRPTVAAAYLIQELAFRYITGQPIPKLKTEPSNSTSSKPSRKPRKKPSSTTKPDNTVKKHTAYIRFDTRGKLTIGSSPRERHKEFWIVPEHMRSRPVSGGKTTVKACVKGPGRESPEAIEAMKSVQQAQSKLEELNGKFKFIYPQGYND